jgi:hypothetical protein
MKDLFQPPRFSLELKSKVNRRLVIMIKVYMVFCQEIDQMSEKRDKVKSFDHLHHECQLYFNSISRSMPVKMLADKVLFGRPLLQALLPKEYNVHFGAALKEYNAIVQFCMDERRSRKEISIFNAKDFLIPNELQCQE